MNQSYEMRATFGGNPEWRASLGTLVLRVVPTTQLTAIACYNMIKRNIGGSINRSR